jgi:extracellular factor (EF) 3-hydroxypalmitic acid methyl ester biosynthesis protein
MTNSKSTSLRRGNPGADARCAARLELVPASAPDAATRAALVFTTVLAGLERGARHERRTVPTPEERRLLREAFWERLIPVLERVDAQLSGSTLAVARRDVQEVLNPWLLRSGLWARSWLKPHGFPGDYRMLEWIYDLAHDECDPKDQPAAVNLLDDLYRSVHSVRAVWERRDWFAQLIADHVGHRRPVRLLDLACGGSRYVRDVIQAHGSAAVQPTLVDQDPSALAFVRSWLPTATAATIICAPIRQTRELSLTSTSADARQFDVVISTGLFDYLETDTARALIAHACALTRPGGVVAISNFSPDDASRVVKDWVADWPLIYRTRQEVAALFPAGIAATLRRSTDGGLLYAQAVIPHGPTPTVEHNEHEPGGDRS